MRLGSAIPVAAELQGELQPQRRTPARFCAGVHAHAPLHRCTSRVSEHPAAPGGSGSPGAPSAPVPYPSWREGMEQPQPRRSTDAAGGRPARRGRVTRGTRGGSPRGQGLLAAEGNPAAPGDRRGGWLGSSGAGLRRSPRHRPQRAPYPRTPFPPSLTSLRTPGTHTAGRGAGGAAGGSGLRLGAAEA